MRVELGPGGPALVDAEPLRPKGENAVLVRVELAGLCRSDLKEVAGNRHGVSQFGHELVGVVEESTVDGLGPGDRVTLDPNVPLERGTGFATSMWAAGPAGKLRAALPVVPADVDARRLIFTEPLACAQHCLGAAARHIGEDLAGQRVGVLGAGTAGALIAGLAHALGAEVVLGNRSQDRTDFLRDRAVLDAPIGPLEEMPSDGLDIAIVATSFVLPEVLREALRTVVPGGLVLLYGGTAPGDALPGLDCDLDGVRRGELVTSASWDGKPVRVGGSYGTVQDDFGAAIRALVELDPSALPVERMITEEIPLTALPGTIRTQLVTRPLGKTLIHP
ncbi:alcohol dehydrogenase catalytic domain-containing protein [Allokutzneria sp. A3M-2-11 16]|uniref:alcohol dehydrogenase catalytic domain-containing protein n=1 Tax=Allokutzneria sp. A3M-2-11 16 TaxID=2962043 RepID=UPI0020B66155|nr:alcohol dehydrogenase catalytic domain-containing protein [Allokutzneria sp. A3M-2-11 16]MCP3803628.1 alcohol dehydrogenase catalytic domain-containing protein [Allokutzneria sp. A3M-2-11 16]